MSLKKRLRTLMVCIVLQFGVLSSVPMRPEEIQELMHLMNQSKAANTLREDDERGDD